MASDDLVSALADVSRLGKFDGRPVLRSSIKLTKAGDGLSSAMRVEPEEFHSGERRYVVVEIVVGQITHDPITTDDVIHGFERKHEFVAEAATIVDASLVADAIEAQKATIQLARERAANRASDSLADGEPGEDERTTVMRRDHFAGKHKKSARKSCPVCQEEQEEDGE